MSHTYKDLQNSHPCFGGQKNNAGRIHLPVSPGCNIACRFCDRAINDVEERPGVTSRLVKPEECEQILKKHWIFARILKLWASPDREIHWHQIMRWKPSKL